MLNIGVADVTVLTVSELVMYEQANAGHCAAESLQLLAPILYAREVITVPLSCLVLEAKVGCTLDSACLLAGSIYPAQGTALVRGGRKMASGMQLQHRLLARCKEDDQRGPSQEV